MPFQSTPRLNEHGFRLRPCWKKRRVYLHRRMKLNIDISQKNKKFNFWGVWILMHKTCCLKSELPFFKCNVGDGDSHVGNQTCSYG